MQWEIQKLQPPPHTHTHAHLHGHPHPNSHTLSAESRSYGVFLPEFMCVRWEHKTTIIKGRLELPCSLGLGRWLQHFRVVTKWSAFDSGPKHDITRWMSEDTFYCFHLCFLDGIQERNIPPTSTSNSVAMAVHYGGFVCLENSLV